MSVIVKASQRTHGQELARHLQNEADNESVDFCHLRGSVSDTLPEAFSEWKIHSLVTNCKKELYSVSINPKEEWSRDWYFEFLDRMEENLGLTNQPRVVVFHVKNGREHAHAAYSRIDVENQKAVHLAFDHDKIKMVVKEFAREKNFELPEGYYKNMRQHEGKGQLLLHEKAQQDLTDLTKEQRQEIITDIWRRRDTPQSFVTELQDEGYMLCKGKRPLAVVDYFGFVNSLPRLITEKGGHTNAIRKFLEPVIDLDNLPDVDEMRKLIGKHRKQEEQFIKTTAQHERREQIKRHHVERRADLGIELQQLRVRHEKDLLDIKAVQFDRRAKLRAEYFSQKSSITLQRTQAQKQGLPALLARATGINFLRRTFHRYQDRSTYQQFSDQKIVMHQLQEEHRQRVLHEQNNLQRQIHSRLKSLEYLEKEELRAIDKKDIKEQRIQKRQWVEQVPSLRFILSPYQHRKSNVPKAKEKYSSELSKSVRRAIKADQTTQQRVEQVDPSVLNQTNSSTKTQIPKRTKTRTMPGRGNRDGGKKR